MANDFDRDELFGDFDDDDGGGGFDDFQGFDDEGFDEFDDGGFDDFDDGGFDEGGFDDFDDGGFDDFDDDGDLSLDDDFDDFDGATTAGGDGNRPSPIFILLAIVLVIVFLGGLALVAFLVINGRGPSATQMTATSIAATNAEIELLEIQTATQSKINLDLTMTADAFTDTPTPTLTPTFTFTPTEDTSALQTQQAQSTFDAANALATGTAVASATSFALTVNPPVIQPASPTPIGSAGDEAPDISLAVPVLVDGAPYQVDGQGFADGTLPLVVIESEPYVIIAGVAYPVTGITINFDNGVPSGVEGDPVIVEPPTSLVSQGTPIAGGGTPVELGAVQMTATALSEVLITPTMDMSSGETTPVPDGGTSAVIAATQTAEAFELGAGGGSTPSTSLPDTGLFDDVFGGNPLAILFTAFGLLGVIVVSRQLRRKNKNRK